PRHERAATRGECHDLLHLACWHDRLDDPARVRMMPPRSGRDASLCGARERESLPGFAALAMQVETTLFDAELQSQRPKRAVDSGSRMPIHTVLGNSQDSPRVTSLRIENSANIPGCPRCVREILVDPFFEGSRLLIRGQPESS